MGRELRRAGGGRYKGTAGSKHRDPKRGRERDGKEWKTQRQKARSRLERER